MAKLPEIKEKPLNAGIYQIVNLINGKRYIGSATDIKQRLKRHTSTLNNNSHYNQYLQRSYNKYGKEKFQFLVILYCETENLIFYEQRAIDSYDFDKELYNISPTAGSPLGVRHSDETKIKNSLARQGPRNHFYGKTHTEECKKIIGEKSKNRPLTEQNRENRRIASTGRKHTEETKRKISESQRGPKNHNYGKKSSKETRKKMSITRRGISNEKIKKPIYQIDQHTNEIIKEWSGIVDAQRELKIWDISKVCTGKMESTGGFKWKFANKKEVKEYGTITESKS